MLDDAASARTVGNYGSLQAFNASTVSAEIIILMPVAAPRHRKNRLVLATTHLHGINQHFWPQGAGLFHGGARRLSFHRCPPPDAQAGWSLFVRVSSGSAALTVHKHEALQPDCRAPGRL